MLTLAIINSLLRLSRSLKRALVITSDVMVTGFSVWLAFGFLSDQWGYFQFQQWLVFLAAVGFSFPLFIFFGLYRAIFRYIGSDAFISLINVFFLYITLFFSVFTLYGVDEVPKSVGIIQPMLMFVGIGFSRYFIWYWLNELNGIHKKFHRAQSFALIYGAGTAGRQLSASLLSNKLIQLMGFVDDDLCLQGGTINGMPVYPNKGLKVLIRKLGVTDVFLAIPSGSQNRRREIITSLSECGVRVRTLPGINDLVSGRVKVSDLHNLDMNDLLGRAEVPAEIGLLKKNILNQVVLVTGAGGSIGSELCRQMIKLSPKSIILIDNNEFSLYLIYEELKRAIVGSEDDQLAGGCSDLDFSSLNPGLPIQLMPCLASVRDRDQLIKIFKTHKPSTVFHAAAYKHVPMVEQNPEESIQNNVFGTLTTAQVSLESGVRNFILVSTDKAVRPTNIMGASKRIAELILQALANNAAKACQATTFSMVRFGNVLGSSGSVVPLFYSQIASGGPITLTHPEVTRYFMTIPEAAQLVLQASTMADGGDVFVLDMGEPVRIYDLAVRMIYLSGLIVRDKSRPYGDIEIKVTGMRQGEKLYEELLIGNDPKPTLHPKIWKAHEEFLSWDDLRQDLEELNKALVACDVKMLKESIKKLVPGYQPDGDLVNFKGAFPGC